METSSKQGSRNYQAYQMAKTRDENFVNRKCKRYNDNTLKIHVFINNVSSPYLTQSLEYQYVHKPTILMPGQKDSNFDCTS